MKNELHPWEVGIAEQVKGKEFSFDPQAFADFEELLQAEALGQETGQRAPEAVGEILSAGGTTVSIPMVLLAIGLACVAGWWFLPDESELLAEPAITTSVQGAAPSPTTNTVPAAPPSSTVLTETKELGNVREQINSSSEGVNYTLHDASSDVAGLGETTDMTELIQVVGPSSPRNLQATNRLPTLPIEDVVPLRAETIRIPTVQKPTPSLNKRDRKALFPDVIKKN